MNDRMSEQPSRMKRLRLPLLLAVIALTFYILGMVAVSNG